MTPGPATEPGGKRSKGRHFGRWILFFLLLIPLLEIATIIAVGNLVGPWWTFGSLIFLSVIGAALVHREGKRTWTALREALRKGGTPAKEITDAGLVLVGGAMLLAPGFLTDALGLFFVLPFTRPITRLWLQAVVASRLLGQFAGPRTPPRNGGPRHTTRPGGGDVIEGEVITPPNTRNDTAGESGRTTS